MPKDFKILVTGDRNWEHALPIVDALEPILEEFDLAPREVTVIHGAAPGADTIASLIAEALGMNTDPHPAHWRHTENCSEGCRKMVGRAAGPIRNKEMLESNPDIDLALAFHPDLSKSKGTANMVKLLENAGIEVRHFKS